MISITKTFPEFPFAHRQWKHEGHCRHIHGHNWTFEITFSCDVVDELGFVVDFGKLKWIKEVLTEYFDHTCVLSSNDPLIKGFHAVGGNDAWNLTIVPDASCEGLAVFVFSDINERIRCAVGLEDLRLRNVRVTKVTLFEDSKNSATYDKS